MIPQHNAHRPSWQCCQGRGGEEGLCGGEGPEAGQEMGQEQVKTSWGSSTKKKQQA